MKLEILPIFDSINFLHKNRESVVLPAMELSSDFSISLDFLKNYTGSLGTFNSYRREVERILQWTWNIKHKMLSDLKRDDIEQFVRFCQNPPITWISLKKVPRFIQKEDKRIPNNEWKPFVATVKKAERKRGINPCLDKFALSQGATQEIFAILSTFFNFLIAEEYVKSNPVALIRQKSKFIRKRQNQLPVRRLSLVQWDKVYEMAEKLAHENPKKHERTRFIISMLFGMYLRISELAASTRWVPLMNHFIKDSQGNWWFKTVGKGNKERQIAVSDAMLQSLIRWRQFLGFPGLPSPADNNPLLPKIKGIGPLSDTAPIRRLVQQCFDLAIESLRLQNKMEEADNLESATVHWLRHTGISEDVKIRPREHVRDDAGHFSSTTTDRYIDVELQERHQSARHKKIESIDEIT